MSDERPFNMREAGGTCDDCGRLNVAGVLCPFHAAAGETVKALVEICERIDALQAIVSDAADELMDLSTLLADLKGSVP